MCTAVLVVLINIITMSQGMVGVGHLLWFALPVVIWMLSRKYIKDREHAPVSIVSSMIAKTWITFGYFGTGFFIIAVIWGILAPHLMSPSEYMASQIRVAPVIVLLMGMAITMTGHILKQRWLVTFGIVAGLLCFAWEHFHVGEAIVMNLAFVESPSPLTAAAINSSLPCLTIFIFALVGLLLPGMMLKKQNV